MHDSARLGGLFIARHRVAKGLSQTALAAAVGISRPYLSQIESGAREPSEEVLMRLMVTLGASFEEFVREIAPADMDPAQIEAMVTLLQPMQALQEGLPTEALLNTLKAIPTDAQMMGALAQLGGLELPPGPAGWLDLSEEDRRLVQRFVNRLLRRGGPDGD